MSVTLSPGELRQVQAFQGLSDHQLALLAAALVRQTYEPGQVIFLEGDPAVGLWFVAEGQIRLVRQSLNGRVQALCYLNRGKCFGSCPLFHDSVNPATAEALSPVVLFILPTETLRSFLRDEPTFAAALLRIYTQRLNLLARLSEHLGSWTTADRLNDCLIRHATRHGDKLSVALTHDQLAALAGTVREVVTRHLSALQEKGVVKVEPGNITLFDVGSLTRPCIQQKLRTQPE